MIADYLIKKGVDVNKLDDEGRSVIFHVSANNSLETLKKALAADNTHINTLDKNKYAPMHIAADYKNKKIVELLIHNGANINIKGRDGNTPAHVAAREGNAAILKLLIESKASILVKNDHGDTVIYSAFQDQNKKCVAELLKAEFTLSKNKQGQNILDLDKKFELGFSNMMQNYCMAEAAVESVDENDATFEGIFLEVESSYQ